MATLTSTPTFTRLPAQPDRAELCFDQHVAMRPKYPVSVKWIAGKPETPGLSFGDYNHCATHSRKLFAGRKMAIPAWALDDVLLRQRLLWVMERRAGFRCPQSGGFAERFARIEKRNIIIRERLIATLDKLCKEYVGLKIVGPGGGGGPKKLRRLEIEIENLDSMLILIGRFAEVFAVIIYRYYRLGESSVEIAAALAMKPPAVRQIISRANTPIPPVMERLTQQQQPQQQAQQPQPVKARPVNRGRPRTCEKCGTDYIPGRRGKMSTFCGQRCRTACRESSKRQSKARKRQFLCKPCKKVRDKKRRSDAGSFNFTSQFPTQHQGTADERQIVVEKREGCFRAG